MPGNINPREKKNWFVKKLVLHANRASPKLPEATGVSDRGSKCRGPFNQIMKQIFLSLVVVSSWILSVPAQSENAEPKIGDAPPAFGLEKVLQAPEGKKALPSQTKTKRSSCHS